MLEQARQAWRNAGEAMGRYMPVSHEIIVHGISPTTKLKQVLDGYPDVMKFVRDRWAEGKNVSLRPDSGKATLLVAVSAGVLGSLSGFHFIRTSKKNKDQ